MSIINLKEKIKVHFSLLKEIDKIKVEELTTKKKEIEDKIETKKFKKEFENIIYKYEILGKNKYNMEKKEIENKIGKLLDSIFFKNNSKKTVDNIDNTILLFKKYSDSVNEDNHNKIGKFLDNNIKEINEYIFKEISYINKSITELGLLNELKETNKIEIFKLFRKIIILTTSIDLKLNYKKTFEETFKKTFGEKFEEKFEETFGETFKKTFEKKIGEILKLKYDIDKEHKLFYINKEYLIIKDDINKKKDKDDIRKINNKINSLINILDDIIDNGSIDEIINKYLELKSNLELLVVS